MTTTEILQKVNIDEEFSSRRLRRFNEPAAVTKMEEEYVLPGGVIGTLKELTHTPLTTTRAIKRSQQVMAGLYELTNVTPEDRKKYANGTRDTRTGLVRDIFTADANIGEKEDMRVKKAEATVTSLIQTAATLYNRGRSSIPLPEVK